MATFLWETEAACPIKETKDDSQVRRGGDNCIHTLNILFFFPSTPCCCV